MSAATSVVSGTGALNISSLKASVALTASSAPRAVGDLFFDSASCTLWTCSKDSPETVAWRLIKNKEGQALLEPKSFLCSDFSSTCAVSKTSVGEEESLVAMMGKDGSVTLWESSVCVASKKNVTSLRPERAFLLSDGVHFAVIGQGAEIEIVNVATLQVVACVHHGHQSWLLDIFPLPHLGGPLEQRPPAFASLSEDGSVVFWSFDLSQPSPIIPVGSFVSNAPSPKALCLSPDQKIVAIVADHRIDVWRTQKPSLLYSLSALPFNPQGCRFASRGRLVVWSDGHDMLAHWYALPPQWTTQLPEPQFGPSSTPQQKNEQYHRRRPFLSKSANRVKFFQKAKNVLTQSVPSLPFRSSPAPTSPVDEISFHRSRTGVIFQTRDTADEPQMSPVSDLARSTSPDADEEEDPFSVPADVVEPKLFACISERANITRCTFEEPYFFGGASDGSVVVWMMPSVYNASSVQQLDPHVVGSLGPGPEAPCECVVVVVDSITLAAVSIHGYADGRLEAFTFPTTESSSPLWRVEKAHAGPVKCLYCPGEGHAVVSGGQDGRLIIWNAAKGQPLHVFAHHSHAIERIVGPPFKKESDVRWRHACLTVSKDRCVGMFSLQNFSCLYMFTGHGGQVEKLIWREDQDCLVVGCADGSAAVWELASGSLLEMSHGQRALDLLETGTCLLTGSGKLNRRGVRGSFVRMYCVPQVAGMYMVSLNVLALLRELSSPRAAAASKYVTLLMPWDELDAELAAHVAIVLGLHRPKDAVVCAVRGVSGNSSWVVPRVGRAWEVSSRVTATQMMCVMATMQRLMLNSLDVTYKNVCARVISRVCIKLANYNNNVDPMFVAPSLATLVVRWQDPVDDVMEAARALFSCLLENLSTGEISSLISLYDGALSDAQYQSPRFRAIAALVLAAFGARGCGLDPPVAARVTDFLIQMLQQERDSNFAVAAAELLGGGYGSWSKGTQSATESLTVMERLLRMSLQKDPPNVAEIARRALLSIGGAQPESLVRLLTSTVSNNESATMEIVAALTLMRDWSKKAPLSMLPNLSILVSTLVRSLDPNQATRRKACLSAASASLNVLVRKFPMVSFDQQTQRVAVGASNSQIVMYDMGTATEFARLDGHKGAVVAVSFSPSGKSIASYCLVQGQIKVWSVTSSFFGFGSSPHCVSTISVDPKNLQAARARATPQQLLEQLELKWHDETTIILSRTWVGTLQFQLQK